MLTEVKQMLRALDDAELATLYGKAFKSLLDGMMAQGFTREEAFVLIQNFKLQ